MKKILWYTFLAITTQTSAMHHEHAPGHDEIESTEIAYYKTFLFYTWGPRLYEFHEKNPQNFDAQKLERFKNNYLCAAILYKHFKKCSQHDAARLAYRNTPVGACALHNILHDTLEDFHEDDYSGTNLIGRWRDELEYIENNLAKGPAN